MSDKLPASNKDAERGLIGAAFRNNAVIDDVADQIDEGSFYTDSHQRIWRAMVSLRASSAPVNEITVAEFAQGEGSLTDIGGVGYLAGLLEAGGDLDHAKACARIVKRHAVTRSIVEACKEIIADAESRSMRSEELLDAAESRIFAVSQRGHSGTVQPHSVVVDEALAILDRRVTMFRDKKTTGALPYGLIDLDKVTAGMHPGELVVIGARPGVGKTIFGCHLADIASVNRMPAMFVSLEQARHELALRLLAKHSQVGAFLIRQGSVTNEQREMLRSAAARVRGLPLWWDDTPSQTVFRIASQARRLKAKHGLQLLVVDYMQLIDAANKKQKRHEQVGEMSRALKLLARSLNIPVIAMAQLNRSSENESREPKLSDLRESGNVEQDADTVILMHPETEMAPGQKTAMIRLLIRKQRNGPICGVTVCHDKEHYALCNADEYARHLP
jgi:replicative DNA helicase